MQKIIHTIIAVIIVFMTTPVLSEDERQLSLGELRHKANVILQLPNVSVRRDIDVVFELVDLLHQKNQYEEAEKYVAKGLKHFPWNLEYQMVYAELLAKSGKQKKAEDKAILVFQYAETDELINRACKILDKSPLKQFEEIKKLSGEKPCIVLVPFQNCDKFIITRIKEELATKLKIPVLIQKIDTEFPPFSRDRRGATINKIRRRFIKKINDIQLANAMPFICGTYLWCEKMHKSNMRTSVPEFFIRA